MPRSAVVAQARLVLVRVGQLGFGGVEADLPSFAWLQLAPEVYQSVAGRVRGSPKRVMTLVLKLVMAVMWSPAVVMARRQ